jgi:hypothetical protein
MHDLTNIDKYLSSSKPPTILFLSSLYFITNIATAFYKKYYIHSFLFFILTITSLIVHFTEFNIYTNIIDKLAVLSVVIYGGYILYNKINVNKYINIFILFICFILCIFFYIYGYFQKIYCFDPDKYISENYHSIMHILASIGHHFVVFL